MPTAQLRVPSTRRFGTLSPLRYPGGKASLAGLFTDLIQDLEIERPIYAEPYAGGAGAGIALLLNDVVDELIINDIDPAIYSFWSSLTNNNEKFIEKVMSTPLTMDEWRQQQQIYRASNSSNQLDLGFAFFYLNRTNRSGILNAGVIGGNNQQGNYKMDARFNRETLSARIKAIGDRAKQITVSDLDGRSLIQQYSSDPSVFFYVDPPYVKAGSQLYLNAFDGRDHRSLARAITEISEAHWLLTYDIDPLIESLYRDHFQCRLDINYSANKVSKAQELMVASQTVSSALIKLLRDDSLQYSRAV